MSKTILEHLKEAREKIDNMTSEEFINLLNEKITKEDLETCKSYSILERFLLNDYIIECQTKEVEND